MTETPNYIRLQGNGCFGLCQAAEAAGIVYDGTVYHLLGRPELEEVHTVTLEEVDVGRNIWETQRSVEKIKESLATTDDVAIKLYETMQKKDDVDAVQDDALIELYELMGG